MTVRIQLAMLACCALALSGCGGGDAKNDAAPVAPVVTVTASNKALHFSWTASEATHYQLLRVDGVKSFSQIGLDIIGTTVALPVSVHQLNWTTTKYRIAACNGAGCTQSVDLNLTTDLMLAAIETMASTDIANEDYPSALAFSANGDTLAVGVANEDSAAHGIDGDQNDNSSFQSGAVFVYERQASGQWQQQAYLKASNAQAYDEFGAAVSLSSDGNTLVVGSPGESSSATVVNGDQANTAAPGAGAAYVFARINGRWSQTAYLKSFNAGIGDDFGTSVAVSGDGRSIIVGAPEEDSAAAPGDNALSNSGAAYLFNLTSDGWQQGPLLKPYYEIGTDANFGRDVAMNDTGVRAAILTRASGVYVYRRSDAGWNSDNAFNAGVFGAGDRVAMSGDGNTVAVSRPGSPWDQQTNGAVYVFGRDNSAGTWVKTADLLPSSMSSTFADIGFGTSLAMGAQGNCIAVGSPHEDSAAVGVAGNPLDHNGHERGAAYYFTRNASNGWDQVYVKSPTTGSVFFGQTIGLSGDCSVLGVGSVEATGSRAVVHLY